MKEIIVRSELPFLLESCSGYNVSIVHGHEIEGKPAAVVMHHPTIGDIIAEEKAIEESGNDALLIAIVEPFRRLLLEAVFPDAVFLDDKDHLEPSVFQRSEKKKVRFTENEKRTLCELPYGLSSKELSLRLGLSERTIRRLKERLMNKLSLVSSEQLLIYALISYEINTRSS